MRPTRERWYTLRLPTQDLRDLEATLDELISRVRGEGASGRCRRQV